MGIESIRICVLCEFPSEATRQFVITNVVSVIRFDPSLSPRYTPICEAHRPQAQQPSTIASKFHEHAQAPTHLHNYSVPCVKRLTPIPRISGAYSMSGCRRLLRSGGLSQSRCHLGAISVRAHTALPVNPACNAHRRATDPRTDAGAHARDLSQTPPRRGKLTHPAGHPQ